MFSARRLAAAALAITFLLAPAPLRADAGPARGLRASISRDELRAGDLVEIHWDGTIADVAEMEILLSLDGGAHYPLRVSPELDPRAGHYRWRVPNLSSGAARLRIRFGHGHGESWGEAGDSFRIIGTPGASDFNVIHENGWWAGLDGQPSTRRDGALDAGAERLTRWTPSVARATAPEGPGDLHPPRDIVERRLDRIRNASAPSRWDGTSSIPLVMRN